MTLMAAGDDLAECRSRMIRLERAWTERLGIVGDDRRRVRILVTIAGARGDDDVLDV